MVGTVTVGSELSKTQTGLSSRSYPILPFLVFLSLGAAQAVDQVLKIYLELI
jgi:hypothetical protein